jgi:rhamnosyltransferase
MAAEHTTGEMIVMMSQDAVPADEYLLENLALGFADERVAGVFARQIPRPEHSAVTARHTRERPGMQRERRVAQIADRVAYDALRPDEKYHLCTFDNVCAAMRRSVWETMPLMASDFGEDVQWARRVLEAGWKIAYEPEAVVVHSHERPAGYLYRRAYMCHRTLYREFGLACTPSRRALVWLIAKALWRDANTAWEEERGWSRKLRLLARVPGWVIGEYLGQYRGARDEKLQRPYACEGV